MKKLTNTLLTMILVLTLTACGGGGGNDGQDKEAPDLNKYYEDLMAALGEDNTPAMMDVEADFISHFYPGLEDIATKQAVLKMAAITSIPYEFVLLETEDEAGAKAAADILQARVDAQVKGGAYYPETIEGWKKAQVFTEGNVVALICAWDDQEQAVEAFNKLFD